MSVLEATSLLTFNTGSKKHPQLTNIDISDIRKHNVDVESSLDYDITDIYIEISELTRNIITCMSGYVTKMLRKTVSCLDSLDLLFTTENSNYRFMKLRSLGKYELILIIK